MFTPTIAGAVAAAFMASGVPSTAPAQVALAAPSLAQPAAAKAAAPTPTKGVCEKVNYRTINGKTVVYSTLDYTKKYPNRLSSTTVVNAVVKAKFRGQQAREAIAIMVGESALCEKTVNNNAKDNGRGGIKYGYKDRGAWQISDNRRWHPVSNKCAFDVYCSSRYAYRLSKGGKDWRFWHAKDYAFKNFSYVDQIIAEARSKGFKIPGL